VQQLRHWQVWPHKQIKNSFYELPEDSYMALRDSLLQHMVCIVLRHSNVAFSATREPLTDPHLHFMRAGQVLEWSGGGHDAARSGPCGPNCLCGQVGGPHRRSPGPLWACHSISYHVVSCRRSLPDIPPAWSAGPPNLIHQYRRQRRDTLACLLEVLQVLPEEVQSEALRISNRRVYAMLEHMRSHGAQVHTFRGGGG
jgi:hypothetical protein